MLWKCATRNRELCTAKSTGGFARITPVSPPITKVTRNMMENSMAVVKRMRPRTIVSNQSYTFTPVGTPMSIVAIPKMAFTLAPCPIVKKWCNHTVKDNTAIDIVATTSDL